MNTAVVTGPQLLMAFALGFEIECRVGAAVSPGHYPKGWHITSTCGVFGAAAGASRLLGLDAQRIGWAHSMTTLKDRVREIRPEYVGIDPCESLRSGETPQTAGRFVTVRRDETAAECACRSDTHLLPEHRRHGGGEPLGGTDHAQSRVHTHERSEHGIGGEYRVHDGGVGREIEPLPHGPVDFLDLPVTGGLEENFEMPYTSVFSDARPHQASEPHGDVCDTSRRADHPAVRAGLGVVVFVARNGVTSQRREHRTQRNGFRHREPESGDHAADSSCSKILFASEPPTYWPMPPSLRTTR